MEQPLLKSPLLGTQHWNPDAHWIPVGHVVLKHEDGVYAPILVHNPSTGRPRPDPFGTSAPCHRAPRAPPRTRRHPGGFGFTKAHTHTHGAELG